MERCDALLLKNVLGNFIIRYFVELLLWWRVMCKKQMRLFNEFNN